jgi:hypothetical protein
MTPISLRGSTKPLAGARFVIGLCGATLLAFAALLPYAARRQHDALTAPASTLTLTYLKLRLAEQPTDPELRLQIARKLLDAGQFAAARSTLAALARTAQRVSARLLLIEIDRRAWAALPARASSERGAALQRLWSDMRAAQAEPLPDAVGEQLAQLYRTTGQQLLAAEILDGLARHSGDERQVGAADTAWLEANLPLRAAALQAWIAEQTAPAGAQHAQRALTRARSANRPRDALALFDRLQPLYPDDSSLLDIGLTLAQAVDVRRALDLAQALVQRRPGDLDAHRKLATLAEWNGDALRALDAYLWLVRHGAGEPARSRALVLARANWDLPVVRELLEARPTRPRPRASTVRRRPSCQARSRNEPGRSLDTPEADDRLALYAALADGDALHQQLTASLASDPTNAALWQQKLDLELWSDDSASALETASQLARRFPGRDTSERLADLQLALGRPEAALATLLAAEVTRDEGWLRQLALIAWEAGDNAAERHSYQSLVELPSATLADHQRLLELTPDDTSRLELALRAFERFETPSMLNVAIEACRTACSEERQLALLARAEQVPSIRDRVGYWQARIDLHQRRAARAAQGKEFAVATRELREAKSLLARAAKLAPNTSDVYARLHEDQAVQGLSIGLASADLPLLAESYAARTAKLSPRERVYVLGRLGRRTEALALALEAARQPALPERDRAVLEADARALDDGAVRALGAAGETLTMPGLVAWQSSAALEYPTGALAWRGEAGVRQALPSDAADSVLSSVSNDVWARLRARLSRTTLTLGAQVRDGQSLRPVGILQYQLLGAASAGLEARLHVHDTATDTARLRALGARDALVIDGGLPLPKPFSVQARVAAETFYTWQERDYLGAGLTLDAALGANFQLPSSAGTAGVRIAGRIAPRTASQRAKALDPLADTAPWLPHTSEWLGAGASLGRGRLDAPPIVGHEFCYLMDAAIGWLWPAAHFGWTAQVGIGVSPFGADLLSLAARGGNVLGSSSFGATLSYMASIDH